MLSPNLEKYMKELNSKKNRTKKEEETLTELMQLNEVTIKSSNASYRIKPTFGYCPACGKPLSPSVSKQIRGAQQESSLGVCPLCGR